MIPFRFLNLFFYIFLNSTISRCLTFHLLPPFFFHLNFYINFFLLHFNLSPLFLPSCQWQKGQYSLVLLTFVPSSDDSYNRRGGIRTLDVLDKCQLVELHDYWFIPKEDYLEGQNSQIPLSAKICSVLPLFEKYLAIYHLFEIRICETRVS